MLNLKQIHVWVKAALLALFFALPVGAFAASIQNLTLLDSEDGDVLIIEADEALEYQTFDLENPARLVMTFPGAMVNKGVVAIKGDESGVTSVFPKINELGVRLEVGLSEALNYELDEQGGSLIVRFDAVKLNESQAKKTPVIEKIAVKDKGDMTEIVLDGQNMDSNHNAFSTQEGNTLVVDLWGAKSKLTKDRFQYSSQRVKSISIGEADDRTRVVISLFPLADMSQQIDALEDKMVIRLGKLKFVQHNKVTVEGVDFQPDGSSGHINIRTNVTNPIMNVYEKDGNTIVDIEEAVLEVGQERTQDLSAFLGPISQVDAYKVKDNVRVVIRTRGKIEVSSFQHGNVFSLNFVPEQVARAARGERESNGEFAYRGEKVTFDFKDIDIRNALKLIAEMSDLNIIMSDDVTGTLTMRLIDVPWDQALELILSARGLGKEQTGNVLRVAPVEVLRTEYSNKIEAKKGALQLERLVTEFLTLNYTKAADVKKMLEDASDKNSASVKTEKGAMPESGDSGLLSSRGSILMDSRTNTLIIKDTVEAINNVKRLISAIDKPIKQVLIEARIVEVSDTFTHALGVRWGGAVNRLTNYNAPGSVAIGAAGTTQANSDNILSGGQSAAVDRGFLVDLPAAGNGGSIGLSLGSFSNAINLDLELSAAQADGTAKIISNPRIVTSNLTPATVTQGALVPIVTPGSANNPATTTLTKAALTLEVTPQITADDGVILDVTVTKDTPIVFNGETAIDSKAVTTNVYVDNGDTIVIGGVYTRDKGRTTEGVPFFSEIPFLGWLFKRESGRDSKAELLIFITPKIIEGGSGA
jgi:type IV pilus assembly protein PilQ